MSDKLKLPLFLFFCSIREVEDNVIRLLCSISNSIVNTAFAYRSWDFIFFKSVERLVATVCFDAFVVCAEQFNIITVCFCEVYGSSCVFIYFVVVLSSA